MQRGGGSFPFLGKAGADFQLMSWRLRQEFDSATAQNILRRHELHNLNAVFRAGRGAQLRHVGRTVWSTELRDDTGCPFTAFIKTSWGRRRWWPRLTDIIAGQVFQSLAVREWHGLEQLSQIGLRVPQRMALFDEGLLWRRSALICCAVPAAASISDMVCSGAWGQLPRADRHAIFEAVVRMLDRIHAAGLAWRGVCCATSIRNVFRRADGSFGSRLRRRSPRPFAFGPERDLRKLELRSATTGPTRRRSRLSERSPATMRLTTSSFPRARSGPPLSAPGTRVT